VFPRIITEIQTMELAELLLSKYSTILSPGRFFGEERHFRLGLGGEADSLKGALENLGTALDELG
jgi:aspartate/methionine/tyrosine aminotransferase